MKARGWLAVLVLVGAVSAPIGYGALAQRNIVSMTHQIVTAGYSIEDLSNPGCTGSDGEYDCAASALTLANKDVSVVTYRPAGSPKECAFRFERVDSTPLSKSTWEFKLVVDKKGNVEPKLGSTSNKQIGKDWVEGSGGRKTASITAPKPGQLWQFVQGHLDKPAPACKPPAA